MAARAHTGADSDLPSFLASVLDLSADSRTTLGRSLSQKFSHAITGETADIREAIAISLLQTYALAADLDDDSYITTLGGKLNIDKGRLPHGETIFSPSFYPEHKELVKYVYSVMPVQERAMDELLKSTAENYLVRIRRYSLVNEKNFVAEQFTCEWKEKEKYLTCYIFINNSNRKAAVLIPKKYLIASKCTEPLLKQAVFYSARPLDPPTIGPHLHENLRIITQLLTLVQNFSKPLLKYCTKLLARLEETKSTLHLTGGELSAARTSMQEIVQQLEGADFGDGGELPLNTLKRLLAKDDDAKMCDGCGKVARDVDLQCGHSFCAACVKAALPGNFLNVRGELKVAIPCPHTHACPNGQITIDDIRRMDERLFLAKLEETETQWNLRVCPACKRMHNLATFEQLKCGHFMCKYCLATQYSIDIKCPVDNKGAFRTDVSFDTLQGDCHQCQRRFYYKYTVNFSCVVPYDSDFYPGHPQLCNECMAASLQQGCCCQSHAYTPEETEYITANLFFQSDCHKAITAYTDLLGQASCNHKICRDCVVKNGYQSCPACNVRFNPEVMPKCMVCDRFAADVKLRCEHYTHVGCVEELVRRLPGRNWAKCLQCGEYISPASILPRIANHIPSFTAFNDTFGYSFDFKCPFPNGVSKRIQLKELKSSWFTCDCHKAAMCPLCLEPYSDAPHECKYVTIRKTVDSMIEMHQEVVQCPVCQLPEEWTNADWHKCQRCSPETYYAPCCSALYAPIYFHGPAWHRPNCYNFRNEPQLQTASGCTVCKLTNAVCPKPRQLQRPRLIGPGEVAR